MDGSAEQVDASDSAPETSDGGEDAKDVDLIDCGMIGLGQPFALSRNPSSDLFVAGEGFGVQRVAGEPWGVSMRMASGIANIVALSFDASQLAATTFAGEIILRDSDGSERVLRGPLDTGRKRIVFLDQGAAVVVALDYSRLVALRTSDTTVVFERDKVLSMAGSRFSGRTLVATIAAVEIVETASGKTIAMLPTDNLDFGGMACPDGDGACLILHDDGRLVRVDLEGAQFLADEMMQGEFGGISWSALGVAPNGAYLSAVGAKVSDAGTRAVTFLWDASGTLEFGRESQIGMDIYSSVSVDDDGTAYVAGSQLERQTKIAREVLPESCGAISFVGRTKTDWLALADCAAGRLVAWRDDATAVPVKSVGPTGFKSVRTGGEGVVWAISGAGQVAATADVVAGEWLENTERPWKGVILLLAAAGELAATASSMGEVQVWKVDAMGAPKIERQYLSGTADAPTALAITAFGRSAVVQGGVVTISTPEGTVRSKGTLGNVTGFAFSPKGDRLVVVSDDQIYVLDAGSGESLWQYACKGCREAEWMSEEELVVSSGAGLEVERLFQGSVERRSFETDGITSLVFDSLGSEVLTGHGNGTLRRWCVRR